METVTILRAGTTTDPYSGEDTADWSDPTSEVVACLGFAPGGSQDISSSWRVAVSTQPTVFLSTGTDVTSSDRVIVRGDTYEVDGDPADWRHPVTGSRPGLAVTLRRLGDG